MSEQVREHLVKVLMVGESAVGKSCLIQRLIKDEFAPAYAATIAIDFKMKVVEANGERLKMQIWDTAGQERFNTLTAGFFRGSDGIILCYSVTDERSFQSVTKWMGQIARLAPSDVRLVLVGNKNDLERERRVTSDAGAAMAARYGARFLEASAKSGEGVANIFEVMAGLLLDKVRGATDAGPALDNGFQSRNSCCGSAA